MNIKKIILTLAMTHVVINILAQEAISTAGNIASGSGGSVSYTVGQVFYATNTGTSGSVAQGVQQPFEISVVTYIEDTNRISLDCMAFPNPTTDYLILKIDDKLQMQYVAFLYDINGKLIENKKIESKETRILTGNLIPATYFLKIVQMKQTSSQEIKTFKIIKH
jgi:hypothetical protein